MAEPKAGVIQRPPAFGYLPQDPRLDTIAPDITPLSHVLGGRGLDELAARLEELHRKMEAQPGDERLVARWSRAHDAFEHAGGYAAESEVRSLLSGLGLRSDRVDGAITGLSGGERRRVELARILFSGSDLLLLDEPTNHLDNDAREWLFEFLRSYRGALIVISHDLELLDESITRVLHLDRPGEADVGEVTEYKGTFSEYKEARARDEARRAKVAARQQSEIARLQTLIDRWGAKASKAAFAKSLETRIERIRRDGVEAPTARRGLRLRLPDPPPSGRTALTVHGPGQVLRRRPAGVRARRRGGGPGRAAAGPRAQRRRQDQPAAHPGRHLRGRPGRLVTGATRSRSGTTPRSTRASGPERPCWSTWPRRPPGQPEQMRRRLLGMFGLSGDKVHQDASTLSGGEKTKLALSLLVAGRHNLLLLDEPTNNLDPPSREAVAAALASWGGTMVIVSHDVGFVRDLAPDRAVLMPDGDVDFWSDDLLDLVELA